MVALNEGGIDALRGNACMDAPRPAKKLDWFSFLQRCSTQSVEAAIPLPRVGTRNKTMDYSHEMNRIFNLNVFWQVA